MTRAFPVRRKRQRMTVRQSDIVRWRPHLRWVAGFCCVATLKCDGRVQAHHVREPMKATLSEKPGDDQTVPLCFYHHRVGHNIGWETFEKRYGVDLLAIARRLWRESPHRLSYQRKQREQS